MSTKKELNAIVIDTSDVWSSIPVNKIINFILIKFYTTF